MANKKKKVNSKRIIFIILGILALWAFVRFLLGGSEDSWICENGQWVKHGHPSAPMPNKGCEGDKTKLTTVTPKDNTLVGNDKDEHGCIPSAGYSWCEGKQKCLRVWEEPCGDNDNYVGL
jgi:hypothetical protein